MAWLSATPKPRAGSKRAEIEAKADVKRVSRADAMKPKGAAKGWAPPMPPNPLPHIAEWLTEIGPIESAGMGMMPISWLTLDAWVRRTGVDLSPWEARLLRYLSIQYLAEFNRAESENCPPPWRAPITQADIETEVATLMDILG